MIGREGRCAVVDAALYNAQQEPVLTLGGVLIAGRDQLRVPPTPLLKSRPALQACAKDVGILAFEYYCPNLCMRAADLEVFHNCKGRYTVGRGQENITFCSDDKDAVSMGMSALPLRAG